MYPRFDRNRLIVKPLRERRHELTIEHQQSLDETPATIAAESQHAVEILGERLVAARARGKARIMLVDEQVLRAGVARHVIDLMERGLVTQIGMNGGAAIHDYEWGAYGATGENEARYVRSGEFGLWRETGEINDIVRTGAANDQGLGEAIGLAMTQSYFPHKELSILAAGVRLAIPVTVHLGIGFDTIQEHPNFDPASFAIASYRDFLTLAHTVERLEKGVFLCCGCDVMGSEVFTKTLAMSRNVAHQEGQQIAHFTAAALDPAPHGDASATRIWKSILVRTAADGGESFFVGGDPRHTLPLLRLAALRAEAAGAATAEAIVAAEV